MPTGWLRCLAWRAVLVVAAFVLAALARVSLAEEPPPALAPPLDDTNRLYVQFVTGMGFTLDTHFAGDVDIDGEPDLLLGGGLGYNISRHWGVELQFQGGEPDLRSSSRGKIREISIITIVPAARYRWHLLDDRLVPYVTGGVGMSFTDVNEDAKPYTQGGYRQLDHRGLPLRRLRLLPLRERRRGTRGALPDPSQPGGRGQLPGRGGRRRRRFTGDLNLTGISLLAQLRFFLGQQAGPDGRFPGRFRGLRRRFLAANGPFDTDELRFYVAGFFGYDFLFDRAPAAASSCATRAATPT